MAEKPPPPVNPKAAIAWFAARVPFLKDELADMEDAHRKRAFFVSGVAQLRLVADVHKAISKAVTKGTTLADFKKEIGAKLEAEWGGERPAQLETVFRNNVQSAYNAGRLEQFEEPIFKHLRPYRGWAVILDSRTTEAICKPLAHATVPADSAFAKSHIPPLHHRCRTGIMSFNQEEVDERGGETHPIGVHAAPGFGGDPRKPPDVDLSDVPEPLRRIYAKKSS